MAKLIYSPITSFDGYTTDEGGDFGWAAPDEEVHAFFNDLHRPIGTYLLGRRMYEVLAVWEEPELVREQPAAMQDYARIWNRMEKVVFSKTLGAPATSKTRIERYFEPDAIRRMKAEASADLSIGGPELAAFALKANLVDECHFLLSPVIVGNGKAALPHGLKLGLELLSERRFESGFVYLRYRVKDRD
jgi:dihydrofolate reductase